MQLKQVTPKYFVSKIITPGDIVKLVPQGFAKIICNLPDGEIDGSSESKLIRESAGGYGIAFEYIPVTMTAITKEVVAQHTRAVRNTNGAVLSYCATGRRSSVLWAMEFADKMSADAIISRAQSIGYDLEAMRAKLDARASEL